jgi:acylphosphatase
MHPVGEKQSSCRQWIISGRVQGVGFRWFVLRAAKEMSLDGTVRNLPDGKVEVVARGPDCDLQELAAALRRGPFAARVTSVAEAPGFLPDPSQGFRVENGS